VTNPNWGLSLTAGSQEPDETAEHSFVVSIRNAIGMVAPRVVASWPRATPRRGLELRITTAQFAVSPSRASLHGQKYISQSTAWSANVIMPSNELDTRIHTIGSILRDAGSLELHREVALLAVADARQTEYGSPMGNATPTAIMGWAGTGVPCDPLIASTARGWPAHEAASSISRGSSRVAL